MALDLDTFWKMMSKSYRDRIFRTDKHCIVPFPSDKKELLFTVYAIDYVDQRKVLMGGPPSAKTLDGIKEILTEDQWLNFQRHVFDKLV